MPQLASVTITDRNPGGPANHVFTPLNIVGDVATLINSASGVPVAAEKLHVALKRTAQRFNGEVRLAIPVVQTETINGISKPKVVRTAYVTLKASFDQESTTQERSDAIGLMASALATSTTLVDSVLVDLEAVY